MSPKKESLSRRERLSLTEDFKRILGKGKKLWLDKYLLILLYPNHLNCRRLGLIVSKKVGKAAKRNKIKRLLRNLYRKNKEIFPIGTDIVMIPHPNIEKLDYNELLILLKKELSLFRIDELYQ
ncbi:MAG: ribonuclease P protein component [Caldimicrobium sp.]|nr:ribonuclease P protein component [Caldimicrobium sp.]MDW8183179.1 ribonuclease P protein component [Caldimicrobium sp.]